MTDFFKGEIVRRHTESSTRSNGFLGNVGQIARVTRDSCYEVYDATYQVFYLRLISPKEHQQDAEFRVQTKCWGKI